MVDPVLNVPCRTVTDDEDDKRVAHRCVLPAVATVRAKDGSWCGDHCWDHAMDVVNHMEHQGGCVIEVRPAYYAERFRLACDHRNRPGTNAYESTPVCPDCGSYAP